MDTLEVAFLKVGTDKYGFHAKYLPFKMVQIYCGIFPSINSYKVSTLHGRLAFNVFAIVLSSETNSV
jgi:hypothetical protein